MGTATQHLAAAARRHAQLNPACPRRPGVVAFRRGDNRERDVGRTALGVGVCAVPPRYGLLQLCLCLSVHSAAAAHMGHGA